MKRHILIYGLCGGVLIVLLKLVEYRFLVVQHSIEIYGGLIALLFAGLGIWLGLKLTKPKETLVIKEVPVGFAENHHAAFVYRQGQRLDATSR
jgi:two-component system, NarL family, response regulator LiaR